MSLLALPLLGLSLLLAGCADKSRLRFEKIADSAQRDDYAKAASDVRKNKDLYGSANQLLYHMDLGILLHYAGKYDSSIVELSKAVSVHDDLFAKSVSNEALSLVANDNVRPYRGKPHEIVLLHQFLAFNYLALGKYDDALVESRQAQLYLDELKRKAGKDVKAFADDGMFRYLTALIYQATGQRDDAAISMYHAVKAYRAGPIPLPPVVAQDALAVLKATDRQNDIQELKLNEAAVPGIAAPGAGAAQGAGAVDPAGSEIIVIGEAGRSPALDQNVFWGTYARDGMLVIHYRDANGKEVTQVLPAPGLPQSELNKASRGRKTRSGTTFHIKFAMPALKDAPSKTRFFTVAGEAAPVPVKTGRPDRGGTAPGRLPPGEPIGDADPHRDPRGDPHHRRPGDQVRRVRGQSPYQPAPQHRHGRAGRSVRTGRYARLVPAAQNGADRALAGQARRPLPYGAGP